MGLQFLKIPGIVEGTNLVDEKGHGISYIVSVGRMYQDRQYE